jgi:MOSC domain-containing protein YiiM
MKQLSARILGLHTGEVLPFGPKGEPSAIRKSRCDQALLGPLGFDNDEQADLKNHGGTDKALNFYPYENYDWWSRVLRAGNERLSTTSAFGENVTTQGMLETEMCVGDRLAIGETLVEISQGRVPCWKLNHLFGDADIVKQMIETARCGFYARVVEGGLVRATDGVHLVDRPYPAWTIDRTFRLLFHKAKDADALKLLVQLEPLAKSWREKALTRISGLDNQ